MAKREVKLYKFTWQSKEYEMCLGAAAKLVEKSPTFLNRMLKEHKLTFQEAVDAEPGDPKYRKKRRVAPGSNSAENYREKKQARFVEQNKELFNKILRGGLRGRTTI